MHVVNGVLGIDGGDALGLPFRDRIVAAGDAFEEISLFALEAAFTVVILAVARARTFELRTDIADEQQCEIWVEVLADDAMHLQDRLAAELAAEALIGLGGVGEPVA